MVDFPHLLSPLDIGRITVRNRVLVSAHVPGFADNNLPGDRYIAYQRARAAGGVGLQITGGTPIHRSGMISIGSDGLWNLDDSIIPGYRRLAEAVHAEGGRILAQLLHSAGTVLINQQGYESWAPSASRSSFTGGIAHEMSLAEIAEIVAAYGTGAARVAAGHLDGVEVLSAFGFLPNAFFSPLTNWRRDAYGGSLDNRLRFLFEVLEEVRAAIGFERILGVRIPGDEFEPGGLNQQDMQVIASRIADTGLVDYLNVTAHTNHSLVGRTLHWGPTPARHGLFVELAAGIRALVNVPVFTVGRITDPAHAERILAAGKADMVGMTRAHISDPQIVNKIKRGAAAQIRPCVGANTCIANRFLGKPVRCMHNPAAATPGVEVAPASFRRTVLVVGAGPSGLEAARIAAERGHAVEVHEQRVVAGGQLAAWESAPSMGELGAIVSWRLSELARLGVRLHLESTLTAARIRAYGPDVVIVATGSLPHLWPLAGDGSITISTPEDILTGGYGRVDFPAVKSAIVWSDGKGQAGLAAAEVLALAGTKVEIVTSDIAVAADLDPTNRTAWYQRLGQAACEQTARCVVDRVEDGTVGLRDVFTDALAQRHEIDLIVDWRGNQAQSQLIGELGDASFEVIAIGYCISPRSIEVAMGEAAAAAERI